MKLTVDDTKLFCDLTWSLQLFVNRKLGIIPDIDTVGKYLAIPFDRKFLVREKVYEHPDLIDEYVSINPDKLTNEYLSIIAGWKRFVRGEFFIERYLKSHAIIIGVNERVYGVLALGDPLELKVPKHDLPVRVEAVLLPFKGMIIYDGLLQIYSISFGGGVKRRLKEGYMRAKQNNRIITSLDEEIRSGGESTAVNYVDWSRELSELTAISKKLKGGGGQSALVGPVFSLVRASVELANTAVLETADIDALLKELKRVERAVHRLEGKIRRIE